MSRSSKKILILALVVLALLLVAFAMQQGTVPVVPNFQALYDSGKKKQKARDYGGAMAELRAAARTKGDDFPVWIRISEVAVELGDRATALDAVGRAEALNPELKYNQSLQNTKARAEKLPPNQAPPAVPPSPEVALAVATARRLITSVKDGADTKTVEQAAEQAKEVLMPILTDPLLDSADAWDVAARTALLLNDDELAAFAFEAIPRLRPGYPSGAALLDLMAQLNTPSIRDRAIGIAQQRSFAGVPIDQAHARDVAFIRAVARALRDGTFLPRSPEKAIEWMEKGAAAGDGAASTMMALCCAEGSGVTVDKAKASQLAAQALPRLNAAAGTDAACMNCLGILYENGLGVASDAVKAQQWYTQGASSGSVEAMVNLGSMHWSGAGGAKNEAKAVECWTNASKAANGDAMRTLGVLSQKGLGVTKDEAIAVEWFTKAANAGNAAAMFNLGTMYEKGLGVSEDLDKADVWFTKARRAGKLGGTRGKGER